MQPVERTPRYLRLGVPHDIARCADSAGCPHAGDCARTAPAAIDIGPTKLTLFNAARLAEGFCQYYIPAELAA